MTGTSLSKRSPEKVNHYEGRILMIPEERIAQLEAQVAKLTQRLDSAPDLTGVGSHLAVEGASFSNVAVAGSIDLGDELLILSGSNPLKFTARWSGFPDSANNRAEICNDTDQYKTLMLVGNRSASQGRRVSVWDRLEVHGSLQVDADVKAAAVSEAGIPLSEKYQAKGISAGSTVPGTTAWKVYSTTENRQIRGGVVAPITTVHGIFVDVDTSAARFSSTPVYVCSLGGASSHWATVGGSSVYSASPTGFRIYVRWANGDTPPTPAQANEWQWHVLWIGLES